MLKDANGIQLFKKSFSIKAVDEAEGVVTAVIATLNVKDHDGDVTLAGAFGKDQEVTVVPFHDWKHIPIGKAVISEEGEQVIARIKLNRDINAGAEWFKALKFDLEEGTPKIEYSYSFDLLDAEKGQHDGERVQFLKEMEVIELGPLMRGAGLGTGTVQVKGRGASGSKAELEIPGSWESVQRAIRIAARKQLFGDSEEWEGYLFPEATFDGQVIVEAFKEWDPDEWSGRFIQFDWKLGVDGVELTNETEVELDVVVRAKGLDLQYLDEVSLVVGDLLHFKRRCAALASKRSKEGRTLSQANRDRLKRLSQLIADARADLDALLEDTEVEAGEVEKSYNAFLELESQILGGS